MPSTERQPYRFVWRANNAAPRRSQRWYTTTVQASDVSEAIAQFRGHVEQRLKRPLDQVVVDHYFYRGENPTPGQDLALLSASPMSLREHQHPFFIEFANRVYAPGEVAAL